MRGRGASSTTASWPAATAEYPTQPLPGLGESWSRAPLRAALLALAVAVAFADSSIVVLALPELLGDFETTITVGLVGGHRLQPRGRGRGARPDPAGPAPGRRPGSRAWGLVVFCAASWAARSPTAWPCWSTARAIQGVGAALLLAGSVPLLGALCGSQRRGAALWGAAGVVGAAVGPALGGALTQAFDWRAIFIAQVPLAAAAIAATVRPPAAVAAPAPAAAGRDEARIPRLVSGIALALISAALVGALFLAVVLMIDGWGHEPLLAAARGQPAARGGPGRGAGGRPQRPPGGRRGRHPAGGRQPRWRWPCCPSPASRCWAPPWRSAAWAWASACPP